MRGIYAWTSCTRWSVDARMNPRFFRLKRVEYSRWRGFYGEST